MLGQLPSVETMVLGHSVEACITILWCRQSTTIPGAVHVADPMMKALPELMYELQAAGDSLLQPQLKSSC